MNDNQNHLNTNAVDLFSPANRFDSATKLYGRVHRWWLMLRKYWWLPVLIFAVVVAPVYWLTSFSGPTYTSKARMWVTGKINVSESWSYTEELVNFLGTQAALLQSPAIQNRAMDRLQAESKPGEEPGGKSGANNSGLLVETKAFLHKLIAANAIADSNAPPPIPFQVKVVEGAKSSTLELRAIGPDPVSTRKFLDCLMAEYLNFKRESRDQTSTQAAASLSGEATDLKCDLATAQDKLESFQASNNVVLMQQQGNGDINYLATLNRQLAILRTEKKLLDSLKPEQWTQSGALQAAAGQNPGDGATAQQLLASLGQSQAASFQADQQMRLLTARRDELSHFLRPAHPKIIKLNQDIVTQAQIVQAADDEAAKQLTIRRLALDAQIRNLETASKEWDSKAIEAGRKVAQYDKFQQNAQRLQAAYDKTFGLIQNLDVANRIDRENIGVLDWASTAKPTHRLLINLAIAIAFSLVLCFGLLYSLALFQDNFASHTELAEQLAEPVIGQIPSISFNTSKRLPGVDGLERQRFEFEEAFRNIRASLLFMNNGGAPPKTIIITSSAPDEGKSTVALYLAATLAKGNSRVLLIDADMRRPSLHRFFGLPNGPGLAELLNEELSTVDVIFPGGMKNLALLPAGNAKRNPGDLVLSPMWAEFLASVKPRFDYILVDTPPLAATDDAASLTPKVDGVLFVVRALSTSARVAQGALDLLRRRHARVLGLIFNGAVSSPAQRQYYQPYARAYDWKPGSNGTNGRTVHLPPPVVERNVKAVNGCD